MQTQVIAMAAGKPKNLACKHKSTANHRMVSMAKVMFIHKIYIYMYLYVFVILYHIMEGLGNAQDLPTPTCSGWCSCGPQVWS